MSDTETEPAPAEETAEETAGAAPPGGAKPADDAPTGPAEAPAAEGPARPQPPAMTPAQIAEHPAALVRVACDGRCGNTRDLWARDSLPTDPDATDDSPADDPRGLLMAAAGCLDEPRACPGAVGSDPVADAFNSVTVTAADMSTIDLSQMVNRVRGANRSPELEPAVADSGVAPIPLLTVDDLELAAKGEIRLPVATSPFDPPPSPMLAALGVDVANLEPTLIGGLPPGATVESGEADHEVTAAEAVDGGESDHE